jgi:hypothetical protein
MTTVAWVGYTAAYAIYVHERLELTHKPGKQAKFLEQPFRENRQRIIDIIKEEAAKDSTNTGPSVPSV